MASLVAGAASAASIVPSPASVAPGGAVRLSGDVLGPDGTPGCSVPGTVTLISDAFAGLGEFAGVGAVDLPVDAAGTFDASVILTSSVAPGTYEITGRCGGGNLGVTATLHVVLPATGPATDLGRTLTIAVALLVLGIVATVAAARTRSTS
jgi:hypothetical protein